METVKCSEFVKRQTAQSGYSHFDGTWEELEILTSLRFHEGKCKPGYKLGVMLVQVEPFGFYSATCTITEDTKLRVNFAPRQIGEDPFIRVSAKGKKQRAKAVEIILYNKDVLNEDNDRSTNADWEIIAIKARASKEEEPMDPYTMARNFLHLKGGTSATFTAEQFAQSIVYWNNHCMLQAQRSLIQRLSDWFKSVIW